MFDFSKHLRNKTKLPQTMNFDTYCLAAHIVSYSLVHKNEELNVFNFSSESKRKTTRNKWMPSLRNCFDSAESHSIFSPHASMHRWKRTSIESISNFIS